MGTWKDPAFDPYWDITSGMLFMTAEIKQYNHVNFDRPGKMSWFALIPPKTRVQLLSKKPKKTLKKKITTLWNNQYTVWCQGKEYKNCFAVKYKNKKWEFSTVRSKNDRYRGMPAGETLKVSDDSKIDRYEH